MLPILRPKSAAARLPSRPTTADNKRLRIEVVIKPNAQYEWTLDEVKAMVASRVKNKDLQTKSVHVIDPESKTDDDLWRLVTGQAMMPYSDVHKLDLSIPQNGVCVLAYGQTGSGKSHTVSGLLFDAVGSAVQIANSMSGRLSCRLQAVEMIGRSEIECMVKGTKVSVQRFTWDETAGCVGSETFSTTNDLARVLSQLSRTTAPTSRNAASSRKHAFYRLAVTILDSKGGIASEWEIFSIDLCGSERRDAAQLLNKNQDLSSKEAAEVKKREQEGDAIRTDLTELGRFFDLLTRDPHGVPTNPLCKLVNKTISKARKCFFVGTIRPDDFANTAQTISTALRFGTARVALTQRTVSQPVPMMLPDIAQLHNGASKITDLQMAQDEIKVLNKRVLQAAVLQEKVLETLAEAFGEKAPISILDDMREEGSLEKFGEWLEDRLNSARVLFQAALDGSTYKDVGIMTTPTSPSVLERASHEVTGNVNRLRDPVEWEAPNIPDLVQGIERLMVDEQS